MKPVWANITVFIKDGKSRTAKIRTDMLQQLSDGIVAKGFEYMTLVTGTIEVVGFMLYSKQIGQRVIILGESERNEANG